ncbi:MAG: hypothetical protein FJ030_16260 [Chloroflexi bacterium]|nr:hypothetical protein [Chloroflexota bacterium]
MTTDVKPAKPEAKPREHRRGLNISMPQVAAVLVLVLVLWVIIDFNGRIQTEQRISAEADQLSVEVTALAATQSALATELAYVSSDAYVAEWAHRDGRYVQPGEVLVVPVPAEAVTPTPIPRPTPQPTPSSNLQIWLDLFFANGS